MAKNDENTDALLIGRGRKMSFDPRLIKILVVDDEKVSRLVLKRLLQKSGYEDITEVESAADALKLLKEDTPVTNPNASDEEHFQSKQYSLIITDVKMPGMNGIEFLEELQKDEKYRGIPVIMVSTLDELQLVYQCLQKGACDFLIKPVNQGMVQNLWQNVWRKRREQKLVEHHNEQAKTEVELKQEINQLHETVTEAITTPIKAISSAINKLLDERNLTDSVRATLADILKTMQSSTIYRPAVEQFILQKSEDQLDPQTREWFKTEFSLSSEKKRPSLPSGGNLVISSEKSNSDIKQLRSWEFDVWSVSDDFVLFNMIKAMFNDFGLLKEYQIDEENFHRFLIAVRSLYRDSNPYHNFRHAFDVTHMSYLFLTNANAVNYLGRLEVVCLLLSGLLHDVDHPGLNNSFHINTESDLAITYNDQSVLENHHCATAFKLLKRFNILCGLSKEDKVKFRKLMVSCILATDLSKHMKTLADFESLLDSNQGKIDPSNEEHRSLLTMMLIKGADLSNPAKPFNISQYWAQMVQEEFFRQVFFIWRIC
eukprot:TRINITY_DN4375_c0_g1_i1.p1 TRINITY_DN4375_c0_g1~~TRINITY_DN4375_c0_g1_i1.p1  ORF type:complete len:542 (-),score=97.05 TRINITY_DN4375_c0_g1_i1:227-1852(-)